MAANSKMRTSAGERLMFLALCAWQIGAKTRTAASMDICRTPILLSAFSIHFGAHNRTGSS